MRILHFSDLHIGIETYGRPLMEADLGPEGGMPPWFAPGEDHRRYLGHSTRLVDFLCAFDELVAYALEHEVDLVLFAGDAYKSRDPSQTHQREFARRVARLAAGGVPVFLLAGNHDLPHAAYRATAIEIFETLNVPQVTVAEELRVYDVATRSGPLQVLALPWPRRSELLTRDEVRNMPYQEIKRLLEQKVTDLLTDRASQLDPSVPAVLAAHVSLNTAKVGTERMMMIGDDHVLLQSNLAALPVDYIALGHIHRRQELGQRPTAIYPGSLQRVDFGEEDHEAKGFYVVDLDPAVPTKSGRVVSATFHPVTARAFATVAVTIPDDDPDPTATVLQAVDRDRDRVADAIVRVQVKLPAALEPALRDREVRKALEDCGAHTVAAVTREVVRSQRVRLGAAGTESKSPQDLLRFYFDSNDVPRERAEKLTAYARRLMQAEDEAE
ncbi:MAG: exonuclease SbcCD subunit D [Dehalococcoidia bacterium]